MYDLDRGIYPPQFGFPSYKIRMVVPALLSCKDSISEWLESTQVCAWCMLRVVQMTISKSFSWYLNPFISKFLDLSNPVPHSSIDCWSAYEVLSVQYHPYKELKGRVRLSKKNFYHL